MTEQTTMARGKILRDTAVGDGIIFVNDRQMPFSLEQHWRSGIPPEIGMVVDVKISPAGVIESVVQVDPADLAKDQAQKAWGVVSTHGAKGAHMLIDRVGVPTLAAIGVLWVSWVFFNTVSIDLASTQTLSITLYDLLRVFNTGLDLRGLEMLKTAHVGVYGLLMWVVLLAPMASHFHRNRHLVWGYCAPLVFMLILMAATYIQIKSQFNRVTSGMSDLLSDQRIQAMAQQMLDNAVARALSSLSMGLGFYLGLAAAGYLAYVGIQKFRAQRIPFKG